MIIKKNIAKDEKSEYNYLKEGTQSNIKRTPKDDVIFKLLFGKTQNAHILKDFLEALLDINIASLNVDNATELLPEKYDERMGTLDILATLDDGTKVNIEMQNKKHAGIEARAIFYLDKVYLKSIEKSTPYHKIPKAIVIFILNENEFDNIQGFHSAWHWACDSDANVRLDNQEIHIVELPKFRKTVPDLDKKLNQWLVFLDHENEEWINMATEKNNEVKEAQKELDKLFAERQAEYIQYLLDKGEMDRATDRAYYKAEGKAEGESESKIKIAKKLLEAKTPIEVISSATGLSIDEIKELQCDD